MKRIRFQTRIYRPLLDKEGTVIPMCIPYGSEADMEWAKANSADGGIRIEEVADPAGAPTRMDTLEAQLTYTAMMTDTLLEV